MGSHFHDEQPNAVFVIQSQRGQTVVDTIEIFLLDKPLVSDDGPHSRNIQAYQFILLESRFE